MDSFNVSAALGKRKALVIHFSHHANMREGGTFPEDMLTAIEIRHDVPLSCCVVTPGHTMNLPGSVGIIFTPHEKQVLSVSGSDSGSNATADGTDSSAGLPLDPHTFDDSFEIRGAYNEWRVRGADIKGVFVSNPEFIIVKKHLVVTFDEGVVETIGEEQVSLEEVRCAFPEYKLYTITETDIAEI